MSTLFRVMAVLGCAVGLGACDQPGPASGGTEVVARAAESAITLDQAQFPVRLRLYDLELEQFRILREATESALMARLDSADAAPVAELTLEPPDPPAVSVSADPFRLRPGDGANASRPVTVLSFCNFASAHCASLQLRLDALRQLYPAAVEFGARDMELALYPDGGRAAQSSRCALEQGRYWNFHDALYAGSGALDPARLDRAAGMAGVATGPLHACLDSGRWAEAVREDTAEAVSLGLTSVPGVFVNGRYAGADAATPQLIWLVERELQARGIPSPRGSEPVGNADLPVAILALVHSPVPGQGFAIVSASGTASGAELIREGDRIGPTAIVRRVRDDGLVLVRDAQTEFLALQSAARGSDGSTNAVPDVIATPHIAVPVTLDRNEVIVRLADRGGLARVLEPVALRAGDYRLLRISEVAPGSLYELLGLQSGDVVVGVNEQPVHEADIPLWRALETEKEVRLRVMRGGGVAQHYTYRFDD